MSETVVELGYHPAFLDHHPGPEHPERAERLRALLAWIERERPFPLRWREPQAATLGECAGAHDPRYVRALVNLRGESVQLDPDTATSPGSIDAALFAAGAAIRATAAVLDGEATLGVALGRPPGHHAEYGRAMGFCLLNSVAIAAQWARSHGVERVLILDWDVHHGNGTQHLFEERADVLYLSSHLVDGFYPGTGALEEIGIGAGEGYTVNVPLPVGAGDELLVGLLSRLLPPIADRFRPQLILVSAGYDAHARDPLGLCEVSDEGFAQLGALVGEVAARHTDGRVALVLEGGYDLEGLVGGFGASIRGLLGDSGWSSATAASPAGSNAYVERIAAWHRRFWPEIALHDLASAETSRDIGHERPRATGDRARELALGE
jgi:acetoin utilization deacetylase AcuC-like enzyme